MKNLNDQTPTDHRKEENICILHMLSLALKKKKNLLEECFLNFM